MNSLWHNCGNISPTIYTNMLILGKDIFLLLIARMISTNPISSQFTTLYHIEGQYVDFTGDDEPTKRVLSGCYSNSLASKF